MMVYPKISQNRDKPTCIVLLQEVPDHRKIVPYSRPCPLHWDSRSLWCCPVELAVHRGSEARNKWENMDLRLRNDVNIYGRRYQKYSKVNTFWNLGVSVTMCSFFLLVGLFHTSTVGLDAPRVCDFPLLLPCISVETFISTAFHVDLNALGENKKQILKQIGLFVGNEQI